MTNSYSFFKSKIQSPLEKKANQKKILIGWMILLLVGFFYLFVSPKTDPNADLISQLTDTLTLSITFLLALLFTSLPQTKIIHIDNLVKYAYIYRLGDTFNLFLIGLFVVFLLRYNFSIHLYLAAIIICLGPVLPIILTLKWIKSDTFKLEKRKQYLTENSSDQILWIGVFADREYYVDTGVIVMVINVFIDALLKNKDKMEFLESTQPEFKLFLIPPEKETVYSRTITRTSFLIPILDAWMKIIHEKKLLDTRNIFKQYIRSILKEKPHYWPAVFEWLSTLSSHSTFEEVDAFMGSKGLNLMAFLYKEVVGNKNMPLNFLKKQIPKKIKIETSIFQHAIHKTPNEIYENLESEDRIKANLLNFFACKIKKHQHSSLNWQDDDALEKLQTFLTRSKA
jgi:hypothetical protein